MVVVVVGGGERGVVKAGVGVVAFGILRYVRAVQALILNLNKSGTIAFIHYTL